MRPRQLALCRKAPLTPARSSPVPNWKAEQLLPTVDVRGVTRITGAPREGKYRSAGAAGTLEPARGQNGRKAFPPPPPLSPAGVSCAVCSPVTRRPTQHANGKPDNDLRRVGRFVPLYYRPAPAGSQPAGRFEAPPVRWAVCPVQCGLWKKWSTMVRLSRCRNRRPGGTPDRSGQAIRGSTGTAGRGLLGPPAPTAPRRPAG